MFSDPLFARLFYGAILAVAFSFAWASDNQTYLKLGLIAVGHWAAYNIAIAIMGYDRSGVILVTLSSMAAIMTAFVGRVARSYVALIMTWLWIAAATISTAFFYFRAQFASVHYVALNLTFLARMLLLGGMGLVELVRRTGHMPDRYWLGNRDG